MIVCVCLSPAMDLTYHVERFELGRTVRVGRVSSRPGGKAVNVARILHALGDDVELIAPVGGATGAEFAADVERLGLPAHLVASSTPTRRTVTIVAADEAEATVLAEPAVIDCWPALLKLATTRIAGAGVVVVSGRTPHGTPDGAVAALVAATRRAAGVSVVDTSGRALREALPAGPTVVKPNTDELMELVGEIGVAEPVRAVRTLAAGYHTVMVASLGADGVIAANRDHAYSARPARPLTGNPTGAGDALVAGLAHELSGNPHIALADLLPEPVAMSAAAVLSPHAGELDRSVVAAQRAQVVLRELGATP